MELSSCFENLGSAVAGLQISVFQKWHIVYVVQDTHLSLWIAAVK